MAGEPKRRHSSARRKTRRAAIKLVVNLMSCKNCSAAVVPHTVCKECGFYKGKSEGKQKVQVTKA